ncbi:MAG: twin-arginine translocation signal domain-containing protein, partial [Gammaproteobacteria bacterium]
MRTSMHWCISMPVNNKGRHRIMNKINRRSFIKAASTAAAVSAIGFPVIAAAGGKKQVVIVGGGTAGATAAKYIR